MKNATIARIFQEIADFLELQAENPFKIRAYQKAARTIENLPVELEQVMKEGKLREIPGIGEAIAKKISELITTGRLGYYEELRTKFPVGIITLMEIPGIGPKTAMRLSQDLGISTIDGLEKAIADGQVASLYRLGDKVAQNILRHIQRLRRKDQRVPIGEVLPLVEEILAALSHCPGVRNLIPAGSLRRFKETIGDIDIMGTADNPESILREFVRLPQVEEVLLQVTPDHSFFNRA